MKKNICYLILIVIFCSISLSKTLVVGENETFRNIQEAAIYASPGDTIFVKEGSYNGGMHIVNLKGNADNYIYLLGEKNKSAIINGGSNAIQFSDPEYIKIENLIFQGQTGNGVNIDDGGDYATPANNVIIKNCVFRDMNASGNNDLLKLSGLNNFSVDSCIFQNGATGGSGIDMVGCHNGDISRNRFKNMGSNAIQAKGGTQFIEIWANFFENCGQRTLNLGGSTGLAYFRPIDAKFEAADLNVYSNIIIGSIAPIAYVGSIRVKVINNTLINPEKWAIRILQESVDESRFYNCGDNSFKNNLIYLGNLSTETNTGPNTNPESFEFSNNFWYNYQNSNWDGPFIPVVDNNQTINLSPDFENYNLKDFRLKNGSPAIGIINYNSEPFLDYLGKLYKNPRSAGAFEFENNLNIEPKDDNTPITIFPNPASDYIEININFFKQNFNNKYRDNEEIKIFNELGELVIIANAIENRTKQKIEIAQLPLGLYFIKYKNLQEKFVVLR